MLYKNGSIFKRLIWLKTVALGKAIYETVTGAIASFITVRAAPLKSLTVDIEPVQDLHGQTSPYPAGGGANIWNEQWEVGSISNSTGQDESGDSRFRSVGYTPISPSTNYFVVGSKTLGFRYYDSNKTFLSSAVPSLNTVITTPANAYFLRFVCTQSNHYDNDISINYPSSVTTYVPSSNICPISGWSEAKVTRAGKNLLQTLSAANAIKYNGSGLTASDVPNGIAVQGQASGSTHAVGFIALDADDFVGQTITFSTEMSGENASPRAVVFYCAADFTNRTIVSTLNASGSATFTVPNTASGKKIGLGLFSTSGQDSLSAVSTYTNLQLEIGSTATAYEPYSGTTVTIDLDGTRYGGTLDVLTGVLTVDRAIVTLDNTLTESQIALTDRPECTQIAYSPFNNAGKPQTGFVSNIFKDNETDGGLFAIWHSSVATAARMFLGLPKTVTTKAEAVAWFSANPTQVVYYTNASQTVQLTPEEVTALLGQNNIWADAGDVTVEYRSN